MPASNDTAIMAALARIEGQNERQSAKIDEMDRALRGSTDGATPGIVTRLDRVEGHQARATRWAWSAAGAAMTAVVGSAWAILTGKH